MNKQILEGLTELNIFNSKSITEEQYNQGIEKNNRQYIYLSGIYEDGLAGNPKWYKKIDTYNLSNEEINLLLKIDQTKNIRTIKNVAIFFAVLTAISLAISIIGATSIASLF